VSLREARLEDVPFLRDIWRGHLRRGDERQQLDDLRRIVAEASVAPEQRLLVAEYDGTIAGAVYVVATTTTPLNLEPALLVLAPHVAPAYRRKGVGRVLLEAATAFAEERGIGCVATGAAFGSRDANRFLARLGFSPQITYRTVPTHVVRSRLALLLPVTRRRDSRDQLGHVLAARRSLRRARSA
jgi:GNAT superfamily N-acetyltransferase